MSDKLGLKVVNYDNCEALLTLVQKEKNQALPIIGFSEYNFLSLSKNTINLNASFDSIIGKVDIDWMIRSSLPMPITNTYGMGYYLGKPIWNTFNMFPATKQAIKTGQWNISHYNPFRNMTEEGHANAPNAIKYYYGTPNMTIEKMFAPAIENCKCILKK